MDSLFARHKSAVLQFSGGKDSLACLHLLRPWWEQITVLWCDTGDSFPETRRQMDVVLALVPHFLAIRSNQPAQIEENGPPSDLLPVWDSPLGRQCDSSRTHRVQTPFSCCSANIWEPMGQAVNDLRATLVIRGQRASDVKRSPIKSGTVVNGIEYWFPLEAWSEAEVRFFLEGMDVPLPESYGYFNSSMDCMTCTAYLGENVGKVRYLRERYPLVHEVVKGRMAQINEAVQAEMDVMQKAMAA